MNKDEICRKIIKLGRYGTRTLIYYVVTSFITEGALARKAFGVGIEIAESGEAEYYEDLFTDRAWAVRLLDLLASNCVTPMTLKDIIIDFISM